MTFIYDGGEGSDSNSILHADCAEALGLDPLARVDVSQEPCDHCQRE